MTEIRFYHLRTRTLEQALPEILTKVVSQGRRAVVKTQDVASAERLNDYLWTWRPDSFLPHGMKGDSFPADQPVWLTTIDENPNGADVLILTGGAENTQASSFALCCEMFDGMDENAVAAARQRWKTYGEQGFAVTYWQQNDKGGWEQKA
ncbi:MAG TPA: DNA polymerase III subunit chi [Patescibacteria group bacterium]|jgi:DNA polymerase-3 subunit chi|nr:DNA polymerase III subunit chi [Patescibacteria group bacterium]